MYAIATKKIIGFELPKYASPADLRIFCNGALFYMLPFGSRARKFNLPAGLYSSNLPLTKCNPIKYDLPTLPKPNKISPQRKFKHFFETNPNKCTVDISTGKIVWDKDFYNSLSRSEIAFIKMHEKGHYYYRGEGQQSEINCDIFAARQMLIRGFNPSQIAIAHNNSLSKRPEAQKRILTIFNLIKNK